VESVLSQQGVSLEFIIVDDGSTDCSAIILVNYASHDPRVRILYQSNQGLTRALIRGCEAAKGKYIARQDAGDTSLPNRLRLQKAILDQHEHCVFVSCWASMVGPADEYLFTSKGKGRASSPISILSEKQEKFVVIEGPTHHGSVMFRREPCLKAGGYRTAFYYAQDWDLWFRLATLGTFAMVEQCLYRARIAPGSISSSNRYRQATYARLSHKAISLRLYGHSDATAVEEAERLFPRQSGAIRRSDQARAMYFIGKCLMDNNDARASRYFLSAISLYPLLFRAWCWAAISVARHCSVVVIDPFQHGNIWQGIGLAQIRSAGFDDLVQFHERISQAVLPELVAKDLRIQFAFIDGSHMFDEVLIDFFYLDQILEIGGVIVFDDVGLQPVSAVVRFVLANRDYELVEVLEQLRTGVENRGKRLVKRFLRRLGRTDKDQPRHTRSCSAESNGPTL
jgi:glycosyltransferase involved in cell wall biosynthesis